MVIDLDSEEVENGQLINELKMGISTYKKTLMILRPLRNPLLLFTAFSFFTLYFLSLVLFFLLATLPFLSAYLMA